jgi:hypothetical protein
MSRGATNGSSKRRIPAARVPVTIRVPENILKKIDQELGERDVPLSRNNWLLEAAIEKLRKNNDGGTHGAK